MNPPSEVCNKKRESGYKKINGSASIYLNFWSNIVMSWLINPCEHITNMVQYPGTKIGSNFLMRNILENVCSSKLSHI